LIRSQSKRIKTAYQKFRAQIRLLFSDSIYASIGENCLTDDVLKRHGFKSITTPYSHSRSNLDYILQLEANSYATLLAPEHLAYEKINSLTVVRNRHNLHSDNIYQELHQNGFEFTHHDVINNPAHRESYRRKISRLTTFKGKKNIIFFYHYRLCQRQNFERLNKKLIQLQQYYRVNGKQCEINVFTQKIVSCKQDRGIEIQQPHSNIRLFFLKTLAEWAGDDDDLLWARGDDDLFKEMFNEITKK